MPSRSTSRSMPSKTASLAEAMDDDKITKALASARLKEAKNEGSDPEEVEALEHLLKLYDAEAAAKKAVKEAQAKLDLATLKQYGNLTEDEVKTLVLDDKWHATVARRIAVGGRVHSRSTWSPYPGTRRTLRRDRRCTRRRACKISRRRLRSTCRYGGLNDVMTTLRRPSDWSTQQLVGC